MNVSVLATPSIRSGQLQCLSSCSADQELQPFTPSQWLAHNGAIVVNVRVQYCGFTAALARTYLIDPSTADEEQYRAIMDAHQAAIATLIVGASLDEPRAAAKKSLEDAGQVRIRM